MTLLSDRPVGKVIKEVHETIPREGQSVRKAPCIIACTASSAIASGYVDLVVVLALDKFWFG